LLTATSAFAAKDGGTVYICSNAENSIKITADLSEQKYDQVVVVVADGMTKLFHEYKHKKRENLFLLGAVKNSTLQIKKDAKSPVLVSLDTNPETNHSQVAHEGEGVTISKFDATLTVPGMQVANETVSCLETKWSER
jgi:hypothetical protein